MQKLTSKYGYCRSIRFMNLHDGIRYRLARVVINCNRYYRQGMWCTLCLNSPLHRWFQMSLANSRQGEEFSNSPLTATAAWHSHTDGRLLKYGRSGIRHIVLHPFASNILLVGTYDSQAYGWFRTLRQSWFITGAQGSVHINFDWPTGFRLVRNDPGKLIWGLSVSEGRIYTNPFCFHAVGLVRRLKKLLVSLPTWVCDNCLSTSPLIWLESVKPFQLYEK